MLLFWLNKVDTLWAPVVGNRCILSAERNHMGIDAVEQDRPSVTCCSSWISSASNSELLWFHVAVSKRRV